MTGELQTLAQAAFDRSTWRVTAEGELDTAIFGEVVRRKQWIGASHGGQEPGNEWNATRTSHTAWRAIRRGSLAGVKQD